MTARHARLVVLAAILVALAPSVPVHAQQEPTPAEGDDLGVVRRRLDPINSSAGDADPTAQVRCTFG